MTICNLCQLSIEKLPAHMLQFHGIEENIAAYANNLYAKPITKKGYAPMDRSRKLSLVDSMERKLETQGVIFFNKEAR